MASMVAAMQSDEPATLKSDVTTGYGSDSRFDVGHDVHERVENGREM